MSSSQLEANLSQITVPFENGQSIVSRTASEAMAQDHTAALNYGKNADTSAFPTASELLAQYGKDQQNPPPPPPPGAPGISETQQIADEYNYRYPKDTMPTEAKALNSLTKSDLEMVGDMENAIATNNHSALAKDVESFKNDPGKLENLVEPLQLDLEMHNTGDSVLYSSVGNQGTLWVVGNVSEDATTDGKPQGGSSGPMPVTNNAPHSG